MLNDSLVDFKIDEFKSQYADVLFFNSFFVQMLRLGSKYEAAVKRHINRIRSGALQRSTYVLVFGS